MGSEEVRFHRVSAHNGTSDGREGCGHLRIRTHSRVKSRLCCIGLQRCKVARVSPGRTYTFARANVQRPQAEEAEDNEERRHDGPRKCKSELKRELDCRMSGSVIIANESGVEYAQANVCKDGMCKFGRSVSMKDILQPPRVTPISSTPRRRSERIVLLDDLPVDDGDETGRYGNNRFFGVCWTLVC